MADPRFEGDPLSNDEVRSGPLFMVRWASLAAELELDPQPTEDIGFDLAACHTEPQRHYHTMEHVEAVLRHLETLRVTTPTAQLAAFFHDAVFLARPQRSLTPTWPSWLQALTCTTGMSPRCVPSTPISTMRHSEPDARRCSHRFLTESASSTRRLVRSVSRPPHAQICDARSQRCSPTGAVATGGGSSFDP